MQSIHAIDTLSPSCFQRGIERYEAAPVSNLNDNRQANSSLDRHLPPVSPFQYRALMNNKYRLRVSYLNRRVYHLLIRKRAQCFKVLRIIFSLTL